MLIVNSDHVQATVSDQIGDLIIELDAVLTHAGRTERISVPCITAWGCDISEVSVRIGCDALITTQYRIGSAHTPSDRKTMYELLRRAAAAA